jgi:alpha-glucoside transport system substrate-binding protein
MAKGTSIICLVAILVGVVVADSALAQQKKVHIAVLWGGDELEAFKATVARFEKKTDIEVIVESVGRDLPTVLVTRFQAGNPPDLAAMPNPGQMKAFVAEKGLVPLDKSIVADHLQAFVDLGSVEGKLYSVFIDADLKSLIWYSPKRFRAKGYKVPSTWQERLGSTPRSIPPSTPIPSRPRQLESSGKPRPFASMALI